MKRFGLAVIASLATLLVVFSPGEPAWAAIIKTYKQIVLTIVVTPSPVAFFDIRDPARTSMQVASTSLRGLGGARAAAPLVVAQSQTNVQAKMQTVPDPNATYLHFVPHTSTLNAGYGSQTFTCAFEVYTWYNRSTYKLVDWGAGTVSNGTGPFPVFNYPTTSDLSWLAQGVTSSFKAYANNGSPGETTWTGAINTSQQHCIDLTLNVTPDIPAGTYAAALQYGMYVLQ